MSSLAVWLLHELRQAVASLLLLYSRPALSRSRLSVRGNIWSWRSFRRAARIMLGNFKTHPKNRGWGTQRVFLVCDVDRASSHSNFDERKKETRGKGYLSAYT